jgi:hypothetical protein
MMNRLKILITLLCVAFIANAQTKLVINTKAAGGFCNTYFDLGEQGFALGFNESKNRNDGGKELIHNIQYYSKDLSKRANFKITTLGVLKIISNKNYLLAQDISDDKQIYRVFDFNGKELFKKKIDLNIFGLTQNQIERLHFTNKGELIFETYDGMGELHLFTSNLLNNKENDLQEIDWKRPSAQPLKSMNYIGEWSFLGQYMGYYILARKGANAQFNPSAIAYHIAFYDEDFQLFRELLLDNFLLQGSSLLGKDVSISLNPLTQHFIVSCLIKRAETPAFMAAAFAMGSNNHTLNRQWQKEFQLKDNAKHGLVDMNAVVAPVPPKVFHRGKQITISVANTAFNPNEETVNQLLVIDENGNVLFNEIQNGTFESLNYDNYCVDNNNMYSRLNKLQMTSILKPTCELQNSDVIDIDVDSAGNELLLVMTMDSKKNVLTIYRFAKK